MKLPLAVAITLTALLVSVSAADAIVYKRTANRDLKIFVENPVDWKASDHRPAIVFFFGGRWVGGSPNQFAKQSAYLATRGMVGIRVEYRVIPKGDAGPPIVCVQDAKSALRYVRAHALELGIDPRRIAGAGGSFPAVPTRWCCSIRCSITDRDNGATSVWGSATANFRRRITSQELLRPRSRFSASWTS